MVVDTKLYDTLEIPPNASENEIKKAYRKLAMKHHPDKGGDSSKFKEISSAFEVLSDHEKRVKYDRFGCTDDKPSNNGPGFGVDPMDIFNSFFGNMHGRSNGRHRTEKNTQSINIGVTLEDMFNGKQTKLKIERDSCCESCNGVGSNEPKTTCPQCNGSGVCTRILQFGPGMIQKIQGMCQKCNGKGCCVKKYCELCSGKGTLRQNHIVEFEIPKGCSDNERVIFTDKGDFIPERGYSDLELIIKQKEHNVFSRKNMDLHMIKSISLSDALFGINVPLKHLDNTNYVFKTFPGSVIQYNKVYVAHGLGMKKHNNKVGDLYISFDIVFPTFIKPVNDTDSLSVKHFKTLLKLDKQNKEPRSDSVEVFLKESGHKYSNSENNDQQREPECVQQ